MFYIVMKYIKGVMFGSVTVLNVVMEYFSDVMLLGYSFVVMSCWMKLLFLRYNAVAMTL